MKKNNYRGKQCGKSPNRKTDKTYFGLNSMKSLRQYEINAQYLKLRLRGMV